MSRDVDRQSSTIRYRLPPFRRIVWASNEARDHWQPRLDRFPELLGTLQLREIRGGLRQIAILENSTLGTPETTEELRSGLEVTPLELPPLDAQRMFGRAAPRSAVAIRSEHRRDLTCDRLLKLLDVPACCARSMANVDHTVSEDPARRMAELQMDDVRSPLTLGESLPGANIFWAAFNVRPIGFVPCKFDCAAAHEQFDRLRASLRPDETALFEDLLELLSMAAEWSVLHGIGELRTPIAKVIQDVAPGERPLVLQVLGNRKPRHFSTGLRFPFAAVGA